MAYYTLGKLGVIQNGSQIQIMVDGTKGTAPSLYSLVVRGFTDAEIVVDKKKTPAKFIRFAITDTKGADAWPKNDPNVQVGFVCIDATLAQSLGHSFPCKLWRLRFDKTWVADNRYEPMSVADIQYTPGSNVLSEAQKKPTTNRTIPPKKKKDSEIRLTLGDITVSINREMLLHQMSTMKPRRLANQSWCYIPKLEVYLLNSDARELRTAKAATLKYVSNDGSDLVRLQTNTRDHGAELMRVTTQVKLVAPDGFSVNLPRGDIRKEMRGKVFLYNSKEYKFFPRFHAYFSMGSLGEIESTSVITYNLRDTARTGGIRNAKTKIMQGGTGKPYYELPSNWRTQLPLIETMYEKALYAGTYAPTPQVMKNALISMNMPVPTTVELQGYLAAAGKVVPSKEAWQKAGRVSLEGLELMYEIYLYNSMPSIFWLRRFSELNAAKKN
jgi:hypothetical protein